MTHATQSAAKFAAVRAAAETYWPQLGGQVIDQIAKWDAEVFEGLLLPRAIVLGAMSPVVGHPFLVLDATTAIVQTINSVRRNALMRAVLADYCAAKGIKMRPTSQDYCDLLSGVHERLTGERVWMSAPTNNPPRQPTRPETGEPSMPKSQIQSWPDGVMDLGLIERGA